MINDWVSMMEQKTFISRFRTCALSSIETDFHSVVVTTSTRMLSKLRWTEIQNVTLWSCDLEVRSTLACIFRYFKLTIRSKARTCRQVSSQTSHYTIEVRCNYNSLAPVTPEAIPPHLKHKAQLQPTLWLSFELKIENSKQGTRHESWCWRV